MESVVSDISDMFVSMTPTTDHIDSTETCGKKVSVSVKTKTVEN